MSPLVPQIGGKSPRVCKGLWFAEVRGQWETHYGGLVFWGKPLETAREVVEVRLASARGPLEFSSFFGGFLVELRVKCGGC